MVVFLSKIVHNRPGFPENNRHEVRTYRDFSDAARWLAVRNAALLGRVAAGRPWDERDFRREFLDKPHWRPDWMWFAEDRSGQDDATAGVAVMTANQHTAPSVASIQWLLVRPERQRQGVGRLLLSAIEAAAWEAQRTTLVVETLSEWTDAIAFYKFCGFSAGRI